MIGKQTRRSAIRLTSAAGLSAAVGCALPLAGAPSSTPGVRRDLLHAPIHVPTDFIGMHFHRWPEAGSAATASSPTPTFPFGTVRSHDYGVAWVEIHLGTGHYEWERLDAWVNTHSAKSRTLIYTVYGTPAWLSTMPTVKDAYGHLGAAAPPRDLGALAAFIGALVSRYNGDGKRRLHFIEIWNEPHFQQNGRGFWWGSPAELAAMARTIYHAAKLTDPNIQVMSPGFDGIIAGHYSEDTTGIPAGLRQYLGAPDGEGGTGAHWMDVFSIHTYNADILTPTQGLEGTMLQLRETLRRFRPVPVYTTETGYTPDSAFGRGTLDQKAALLRRQAAVQAALGVRSVCFYSYDDDFDGNPSKNLPVADAFREISARLPGQTLEQVSLLPSGQVLLRTGAGSFLW